jgi:hypothetical protein
VCFKRDARQKRGEIMRRVTRQQDKEIEPDALTER